MAVDYEIYKHEKVNENVDALSRNPRLALSLSASREANASIFHPSITFNKDSIHESSIPTDDDKYNNNAEEQLRAEIISFDEKHQTKQIPIPNIP